LDKENPKKIRLFICSPANEGLTVILLAMKMMGIKRKSGAGSGAKKKSRECGKKKKSLGAGGYFAKSGVKFL
jgi:hypothetical protein